MNLYSQKNQSSKNILFAKLKELNVLLREPETAKSSNPNLLISEYYLDMKKAYGNPEVLRLVTQIFSDQINKYNQKNPREKATFVYASGHNGVPIAAAVAMTLGINNTMVRDRPKNHGDYSFIDGYVPSKQDRGFQIADMLVSGDSSVEMMGKISPAQTIGVLFAAARSNRKLIVKEQYAIFYPGEYVFLKR